MLINIIYVKYICFLSFRKDLDEIVAPIILSIIAVGVMAMNPLKDAKAKEMNEKLAG